MVAAARTAWEQTSDTVTDVTEHPVVRGVGPITALVVSLAAVWRWVFRKPWPWARTVFKGEDDPSGDGRDSGYL